MYIKYLVYIIIIFPCVICAAGVESYDLRVGVRGSADVAWNKLDPAISVSSDMNMLLDNIYRGLVAFDENGDIIPGVAKSWIISKDQKRYVFYLKNIKIHDGSDLTADIVKKSFERVIRKKSYAKYYLQYIEGLDPFVNGTSSDVSGIRIIDDSTIELNLYKPFGPFISYMATTGLSIVKETDGEQLYGCGDYKVSRIGGGEILLERHMQNYEAPKRILVKFYDKSYAFAKAFVDNEVDFIYNMYPSEIEYVKSKGIDVKSFPALSTWSLFINTNSELLGDKKYRRWLMCEYNSRRDIIKRGYLKSLRDYLPEGMYGHAIANIQCDEHVPLKIKSVLRIVVPEEIYDEHEIGLLSEILKEIGADVSIDIDSFGKTFYYKLLNGKYDIIYSRIVSSINDPDFFYLFMDSGPSLNFSRHNDSHITQMIQDARTTVEPDMKHNLYVAINNCILNNAYVIPLWQVLFVYSLRDKYSIKEQAYRYYPSFSEIRMIN